MRDNCISSDHLPKHNNKEENSVSEFAETATLKAAEGFALGLLTASLFSRKQRKNIGLAVMVGAVAVGIPVGIRVLNNNRILVGA